MKLAVLSLCLAYDDSKPVPDKNVIHEAYQVLCEERDNGTISLPTGETFNFKEAAQVARLKERVSQDIAAHSRRKTLQIEESKQIAVILRFLRKKGHNIPNSSKKLYISYEGIE